MFSRIAAGLRYRLQILRGRCDYAVMIYGERVGDYLPKWSQLGAIGRSRAISMTALVPFIGSYIILNKQFHQYLEIIPEATQPSSLLGLSHLVRLYLLYFGLSILGIASILFKGFCPADIKQFGTLHDFVASERQISTLPRTTMMVIDIAKHYLKYRGITLEETDNNWGRLGFSEGLWQITYQSFDIIANKVADEFEEIAGEENQGPDNFFTYKGYTNLGRWMDLVNSPATALRAIAASFYDKSAGMPVEINTIYFLSLDQRRPIIRTLIFLLYSFGFAILSVPTISTFMSIAGSLVSR